MKDREASHNSLWVRIINQVVFVEYNRLYSAIVCKIFSSETLKFFWQSVSIKSTCLHNIYPTPYPLPLGNIFVCYTGGNVKHDNSALALDVITISETSELFLASCVPDLQLRTAQKEKQQI